MEKVPAQGGGIQIPTHLRDIAPTVEEKPLPDSGGGEGGMAGSIFWRSEQSL